MNKDKQLQTPLVMGRSGFDRRFDRRSFGEPLSALRSIPIVDSGEPLVDLRNVAPHILLEPGCLPLLRERVAQMVIHAQSLLPSDHFLVVGTCLRTVDMQRGIQDSFRKDLIEKNPNWSSSTLNRTLNRMIAPPDDKSPAPHTTGAALDVGIKDVAGGRLEFVHPLDHWYGAPTYSSGLSDIAKANRIMLIEAMEAAGLTNYLGEWWHWSFGDQGWAIRTGTPHAFYGRVTVEDAESQKVPKPPEEQTAVQDSNTVEAS